MRILTLLPVLLVYSTSSAADNARTNRHDKAELWVLDKPLTLNERVVSRSFQLALCVVFYSPLQYLHWYDQNRQRVPSGTVSVLPKIFSDLTVKAATEREHLVSPEAYDSELNCDWNI